MKSPDQRIRVFVFLIDINTSPSVEMVPPAMCANVYFPNTSLAVLSSFSGPLPISWMKGCPDVLLICLFLVICEVGCLLMCLRVICSSFYVNFLLIVFAHFSNGLQAIFKNWFVRVLYILRKLTLCLWCELQLFFPVCHLCPRWFLPWGICVHVCGVQYINLCL